MKLYENVTCPPMAYKWTIKLLQSFLIPVLLSFLFEEIFLKIIVVVFGILEYILSSKLTKYGFSVIRSFIRIRIDSKGFSNAFCKIDWNEIEDIYFEHLKIKKKPTNHRKLRFVAGDFGIVMLLHKEKSNTTFKNYSLKKAICVSLNSETKSAILRNCPDGALIKKILNNVQNESILDLICKKESEIKNKRMGIVISAQEILANTVDVGLS